MALEDRVEDAVERRYGIRVGLLRVGRREEEGKALSRAGAGAREALERGHGLLGPRARLEAEVAEHDVHDDGESAHPVSLGPGREYWRGEVGELAYLLDEGLREASLADARLAEEVEARDLVVAIAYIGLE